VQGGNIKSWFSHNKKTYSHIPGTLWMLLVIIRAF
jgi:hypothetical protein